jgi:formiminotetrahydrofolate cyclodeaminase
MIREQAINTFLDQLAAKSSTPGGGSAAAIMGAMGAALASMVSVFTVGKQGYEDVDAEMRSLLERSEDLRRRLTDTIEQDVEAFDRVMAAYRMPKGTDDEKAARTEAIQAALKQAADVPLACAGLCREVLDLCLPVARGGNTMVISDAGVAVLAAEAALRSAALNVWVNLASIRDEAFVAERRSRLDALLAGSRERTEEVYQLVRGKL